MKKQLFTIAAITAITFTVISCGETTKESMTATPDTTLTTAPAGSSEPGVMVGGANMVASKNIVENASASSDHTTLVTAVTQAELAETLIGPGPFTVFAPTNTAFGAVPKSSLDDLMKPEHKQELATVLTYHVVPGTYKAADLKDGQKLKTVQGKELTVKVTDGKVWVNDAQVTIADAVSSNGVTHVIDKVLMP